MTTRDTLAVAQQIVRDIDMYAATVRRKGLTVYLAGPAVFLPCAADEGADLCAIAARYGFKSRFPLDPATDVCGVRSPKFRTVAAAIAYGNEEADRIKDSCLAHIKACDLLIADVSPFRGPGADGGTAFEMGFMSALGKPVFAWSMASDQRYADRISERIDILHDGDGLLIENLGLTDNVHIARSPADGQVHACFEDACGSAAAWFAGGGGNEGGWS